MRTFEQYIDESYSFRLGGSRQKGFEQNAIKEFSGLDDGDIIYWWWSKKPDEIAELEFESYDYDNSKNRIVFHTKGRDYTIWPDDTKAGLNTDVIVRNDTTFRSTFVASTSLEKLIETVYKERKVKLEASCVVPEKDF